MSLRHILITGGAVRLALLIFGAWQDATLPVKYTDIDYEVYTDAARFMTQGESPYRRSTYRYSPLLAAALMPNIWLHPAFGKVLFSAADIVAATLMATLLARRKVPQRQQLVGLGLWLFSPFTVTISTRGNGEALVTCMLLFMLVLIEKGYIKTAGAVYGLAVHWRIYPIAYSLPLLRHLALKSQTHSGSLQGRRTLSSSNKKSMPTTIQQLMLNLVSLKGFEFGTCAAGIFFLLGIGMHKMCGWAFLQETYLYHAMRIDPRHNFSPFFYPAYLMHGGGTVSYRGLNMPYPTAATLSQWMTRIVGDSGWAFTLSVAALVTMLGWTFAEDLPAAFLLQTAAFVAFNKVATAQYFVWHLSWLPLVLPSIRHANRNQLLLAAAGWVIALAHWLAWAYSLEFAGRGVHAGVWFAGLVWVAANAALLVQAVKALRPKQSFD